MLEHNLNDKDISAMGVRKKSAIKWKFIYSVFFIILILAASYQAINYYDNDNSPVYKHVSPVENPFLLDEIKPDPSRIPHLPPKTFSTRKNSNVEVYLEATTNDPVSFLKNTADFLGENSNGRYKIKISIVEK